MAESLPVVDVFPTPLGWIALVGRGQLLARVCLGHDSAAAARRAASAGEEETVQPGRWNPDLAARFEAYANSVRDDFTDVRIELSHLTPFRRAVTRACRQIHFGNTVSYGELAARAGRPRAARAVGATMAANRFPIVVPCHRVVTAGGALGGFSAPPGVSLKWRLLALEADPVGA